MFLLDTARICYWTSSIWKSILVLRAIKMLVRDEFTWLDNVNSFLFNNAEIDELSGASNIFVPPLKPV